MLRSSADLGASWVRIMPDMGGRAGSIPPFFVKALIESSGWVFDGGTGRFASASGVAFETLFRDDVAPFPIVGIDAVGWIAFDASDRSR